MEHASQVDPMMAKLYNSVQGIITLHSGCLFIKHFTSRREKLKLEPSHSLYSSIIMMIKRKEGGGLLSMFCLTNREESLTINRLLKK